MSLAIPSQIVQGISTKPVVYLLAGQGSDHRLFDHLKLIDSFEICPIHYTIPAENASMVDYAHQLAEQIDTSKSFYLIGVSLGGMLAIEMMEFLNPEQVIIISSAKSQDELPYRYKFQKKLKLYKLVNGPTAHLGARVLQPIFEPDRNKEKVTFKAMLQDKDPEFLARTIPMIVEWDRTDYPPGIVHIHGEKDNTIPIRNVKYDHMIKDGSHMMMLTRGDELSVLINAILR